MIKKVNINPTSTYNISRKLRHGSSVVLETNLQLGGGPSYGILIITTSNFGNVISWQILSFLWG